MSADQLPTLDAAPSVGPELTLDPLGLALTVPRSTCPAETEFVDEAESPTLFSMPGYEILGKLGHGGMGVVYKARQLKVNRIVALKMIRGGRYVDLADKARFQIEVEAIARLQHPHIVQLHEAGEHDGQPYFSLELCEGGSLDRKLKKTPLPAVEAAELVEKLARAIHSAHVRGVVHRDLKPANVLLTAEGQPKITDFGLAKRTDTDGKMSKSGAIMGTPSYMAPEQAAGKVHEIGPGVDVYALGAILYECLTGQPPFRSDSVFDTLRLVLTEEPSPPTRLNRHVPRDLETICLKCLHKQAEQRYDTAEALAQDLRRYRAGEPIRARPVGTLERTVKWVRRSPAAAGLIAAALTLVLVVFVSLGLVSSQLVETKKALDEKRQEQLKREKAQQDRSLARINALRDAAPAAVPDLLSELEETRKDVLPRLRELWAEEETGNPTRRMRLALALLPADPELVRDDLAAWLLRAGDPAEVVLVRDVLTPQARTLREPFWEKAGDLKAKPEERFRALVALAAFDPEDQRWAEQARTAVAQLMTANSLHLATWVQALRPVADSLVPPLAATYRNAKSSERRERAATVLADYAAERPELLADLLLDADNSQQFVLLFTPLQRNHEQAVQRLRAELALPVANPDAPITPQGISQRERLARRQATGAVALLKLDAADDAWPLFRHRPDPEARSQLIYRAGVLNLDPKLLVRRLTDEPDVSARRALILTLGEFTAEQLPADVRAPLTEQLLQWYRDDPDAGIHGAIDWLLRQAREGEEPRPLNWGQAAALKQIDTESQRRGLESERCWYVNRQGQTMICIRDPAVFRMGSPLSEPGRENNERPHQRSIGRNFALAARPVTNHDYEAFLKETRPQAIILENKKWSPGPNGPVVGISWLEAARYCNWLSQKDGLPEGEWCYPKNMDLKIGMKLYPNYLKRKGYRFPTEAEWEYAARAGAGTSRYYGSSTELLPRYAWFLLNAQNRAWPVGQKRPNDFGLFDMHGNVFNWIQESMWGYGVAKDGRPLPDVEDTREVKETLLRVSRGGSFVYPARDIRSSYRLNNSPTSHTNMTGIRLARTLP